MDTQREDILTSRARVRLIEGKPGVGKTWFGCHLAEYELSHTSLGLRPFQRILFLTFARNAVARIREVSSSQGRPSGAERKRFATRVHIDTFCGFFWWLVQSYGRYATGGTTKRLWLTGSHEVDTVPVPSGYEPCTFDKVEFRALELLKVEAVRSLISDIYPLVIVDEFQDVHDRLFEIVKEVGRRSRLVLLRGPGQCIYRSLPGRTFDPDALMERCLGELTPIRFELRQLDDSKQRHSRALADFIRLFNVGKSLPPTTAWPIRLFPLQRIPQDCALEVCTALLARSMRGFLRNAQTPRPTVGVLASTNRGVAEIYTRTVKGHRGLQLNGVFRKLDPGAASLLFGDGTLLQYGRLMIQLLKGHWIARHKEEVHSEQIAACITLLFLEQHRNVDPRPASWEKLARLMIEKAAAQRAPTESPEWEARLRNNLSTLNKWLRATQVDLRREGIAGCPSTPFDAGDNVLLNTLAEELLNTLRNDVTATGKLDLDKASPSFERANQGRVISEKFAIQKNIQVMTIHKSKGREFDGVVLVLEDNRKAMWRQDANVSNEEIDDLYRVAITRAKSAFALVAFEDAWIDAAAPVRRLLPKELFRRAAE